MEIHSTSPKQINVPQLKQLCRGYGLEISSLTTGANYMARRMDLTAQEQEIRRLAVDCMDVYIEPGAELHAKVVIGLIRGRRGNRTVAEYETMLAESLEHNQRRSAELAVPLVFEEINRFVSDYYCTAEQCLRFVKKIDSPFFQLHLDTFHMNIEDADMVGEIHRAGTRLGHFHPAGSNRRYPGARHIDFSALLRALKEIGYAGYLTTEHLPLPEDVESARRAIEHMQSLEGTLRNNER